LFAFFRVCSQERGNGDFQATKMLQIGKEVIRYAADNGKQYEVWLFWNYNDYFRKNNLINS
jgi:hypothetical protein